MEPDGQRLLVALVLQYDFLQRVTDGKPSSCDFGKRFFVFCISAHHTRVLAVLSCFQGPLQLGCQARGLAFNRAHHTRLLVQHGVCQRLCRIRCLLSRWRAFKLSLQHAVELIGNDGDALELCGALFRRSFMLFEHHGSV